jgi:lysophospholipase L1-like esterase
MNRMTFFELTATLLLAPAAFAQSALPQAGPTRHPALFLVGDSIMRTGAGNGETGPWGMGYELIPQFDEGKIHVYNEGLGGRSSRGYIEEGAWAKVLGRLQAGDYVILMFGHNDAANSQNYPDRVTLNGNGGETRETESPVTHNKETIHTYGWYLRQYVQETKAKGATPIVCSPVPRNTWIDGKIKRGFDGYAAWAADASRQSGAQFIDLNTLAADRYDALGSEKAASYFNDMQHTTKAGAQLNAAALVEGIKSLKDCPLSNFLVAARLAQTEPQRPALYILGDSTAAAQTRVPTIQGWAVPFLAYFDASKIEVVNAAKGGRSSRTFITEGSLDSVTAKLKPGDTVLIQFGHNDVFPLNDNVARGTLHGIGEETEEIDNKITGKREVVHTYGWYMRKFVTGIRSAGASPVILTLTIRDRWNKDGKIERLPEPDLDLGDANRFTSPSIYSVWAAEVAQSMNVPVIDVHNMIADRYDKEGPDVVSTYFNSARDSTHRNPLGAEVDAAITLAGLKALLGPGFESCLSDKGKAIPAGDARYIFRNSR